MSAQDQLAIKEITQKALAALENNLIFTKYVNCGYEDRLGHIVPSKPISKYRLWWNEALWYLRTLKRAWLDAIKALAGIDPHEHCDEDW